MAATVWKGHLTFGLVSVPVRLFRAARAEKVSLHQLHRTPRPAAPASQVQSAAPEWLPQAERRSEPQRGPQREPQHAPEPQQEETEEIAPVSRIRQTVIDPVENMPIPRSDLVRGYEYAKNQYAVIEEEDIRKITPQTATEMQIVEFVRFSEIDPIYLETSYYMSPEEAGEKAYALLFEGMRESGYAALAQVAMHRREHVMILRPGKKGIIAHTMFYPDEVRTIQEFRTDVSTVTPKELGLAKMLIDTLAEPFEPTKFKDTYRERLRQLIEAKVHGREVAPVAAVRPAVQVVDIMEALQKSLAAARQKAQGPAEEPAPRKTAKSERPASKGRGRAMRGS
jgi:DNA end-binding protein Ku